MGAAAADMVSRNDSSKCENNIIIDADRGVCRQRRGYTAEV